ncbi:hypothetical protein [uncultured Actinomyces sp.]|jgi:hypothetical protein|uniref:hypothetical protein n=1 Tax=uncultured Actinomyces sp. TaxID=249061 RepID=UPI00261D22C3|nr:hypothetical protein [uncultured Actinomyces sp.]
MFCILVNLVFTVMTLAAFSYYLFKQVVYKVPQELALMATEQQFAQMEAEDAAAWYREAITKRYRMLEELSSLKNRRNLSEIDKRRKKELERLIKVNTQSIKDIIHDFNRRHEAISLADRLEDVPLFCLASGIHRLIEERRSSRSTKINEPK